MLRRGASAVAVVVAVAGFVLLVCTGYEMWRSGDGLLPKHMTHEQVKNFEERFRRPGTFDSDKHELQDFMAETADEIAKATGRTWSWRPRVGSESCDLEGDRGEDAPVRKIPADQIVFNAPIGDDQWRAVLPVVLERAKTRGMTDFRSLYEQPGNHSYWFHSPKGEILELNSSFLLGVTDCRLDLE